MQSKIFFIGRQSEFLALDIVGKFHDLIGHAADHFGGRINIVWPQPGVGPRQMRAEGAACALHQLFERFDREH